MKNKGITLIALIITIIIMLILAGIVITLTIGENGILNKAEVAAKKYENKAVEEEYELSKSSNQIDEYINGERLTPQTGFFVDTDRELAFLGNKGSWDTKSYSYTATEDCFATGWIGTKGGGSVASSVDIYINGKQVGFARTDGSSSAAFVPYSYYLKKDDVIMLRASKSSSLKVLYIYGLR